MFSKISLNDVYDKCLAIETFECARGKKNSFLLAYNMGNVANYAVNDSFSIVKKKKENG